jgi:hypothetical protein
MVAATVYAGRREWRTVAINLMLLAASLTVAVARFAELS